MKFRKLTSSALNRANVEEFRRLEKVPVVVLMEDVRSALNVGSAFRTADAFALEEVALVGISAQPPHREILKTALGSTDSVTWQYFEKIESALEHYKNKNFTIISIEQAENSTLLPDFQIKSDEKYVIVFGNEVTGVSDAALAQSDYCIEIPQFGTKHSINVSVCVGILAWTFSSFYKK